MAAEQTIQELVDAQDRKPAEPEVITPPLVTTPPVAPPAPPSTDPATLRAELASLQGNIVREQAQRIMDLQTELANKNATPAVADDAAKFLEAPRAMIREELQEVIAPLMEYLQSVKKVDAYTSLKNECKQHPQLGALLTEVEADVDRLMANSPPTPQNLQAAIFTAKGLRASGLYDAPPVTTPPTPVTTLTPPYIPPSPPAPPRSNAAPADLIKSKVAAMTESEREVARRWGQTPEQYVINRDADENATSWKGGTNV